MTRSRFSAREKGPSWREHVTTTVRRMKRRGVECQQVLVNGADLSLEAKRAGRRPSAILGVPMFPHSEIPKGQFSVITAKMPELEGLSADEREASLSEIAGRAVRIEPTEPRGEPDNESEAS